MAYALSRVGLISDFIPVPGLVANNTTPSLRVLAHPF
jgi:hypothetical protein